MLVLTWHEFQDFDAPLPTRSLSDLCDRCVISIHCRIQTIVSSSGHLFLKPSDASEREIAAEFLSNWLFFLYAKTHVTNANHH